MVILSITYLPPIEYLLAFLKADYVCIEYHENFVKQSYRNRCFIPTANGLLPLSIPVMKNKQHNCPISQVQIDYKQSWQRTHWRAIETAYNTSPFFLYYRDYFEVFYTQQNTDSLFEYNLQLFNLILRLFGIEKQYTLTSEYIDLYGNGITDLRQTIRPKKEDKDCRSVFFTPYRQVFSDRLGFIANTSCIDLLFNEGKFAKDYLVQEIEK
ncbi:MAG: WbqC family protein [Bacteroidales bacterium]|jgi:hypothetical protein|nr:WbqC family protein [Bacteroidales bacterium]